MLARQFTGVKLPVRIASFWWILAKDKITQRSSADVSIIGLEPVWMRTFGSVYWLILIPMLVQELPSANSTFKGIIERL
jgi:hypothetical protein